MSERYVSQASNAHVLAPLAKARLLERLIQRCRSGYFRVAPVPASGGAKEDA
jgi:hypothetical protein